MLYKHSRQTVFILALISTTFISGCFSEEIDYRQTHENQGLIYKLHDTEPYTGRILNFPISLLGLVNVGSCMIEVQKGLPSGETVCSTRSGMIVSRLHFRAGEKDGIEERYDAETGNLTHRIQWQRNKQNGLSAQFNPANGKVIAETHFQNGKKDGAEKYWSGGGETLITSLEWKNGKETGFDNRYNKQQILVDGVPHGRQLELANGQVVAEQNYKMGVRHGLQKTSIHGLTNQEETYENGTLMSTVIREYDIGSLSRLVNQIRVNDKRDKWESLAYDGLEKRWDRSGNVTYEVQWQRGKVISAKHFQWINGQQVGQYNGLGTDDNTQTINQSIVKDGLERVFDLDGRLTAVISWLKGQAIQVAILPPEHMRNEHPNKIGLIDVSNIDARLPGRFFDSVHYESIPYHAEITLLVDIPSIQSTTLAPMPPQNEIEACLREKSEWLKTAEGSSSLMYTDRDKIEAKCYQPDTTQANNAG
ncbi:MORN repeat variant [Pseudomonas aeruginosa]|uniref:hypothetical protein n=1 Tax=Pseudomonas aeruginosa TaxID=287 RepID=UPI000B1C3F84|nr:hypothetical protein [Pseudomonas aeruginosa]SQC54702.1 MORN repeat variant [Pseudomonas aeruginosa]